MKIKISLAVCLLAQIVLSQSSSKELDLWQTAINRRLFVPNHTAFLVGETSDYGKLQLWFKQTAGDFRKSQEAKGLNQYAFDVEGFTDIYRFKAYGSFKYDKSLYKSLANDLRGKKNIWHPFYYFAEHPNDFENQQYFAQTNFSYELIKDHLFAGFGIDFDYNWTTANQDPRPDITNYFIRYKWDIAYKYKNHILGLGYTYGLMLEENNIIYKNLQYKTGNSNPERYINISLGYGDILLSNNNYSLERNGKEHGGSFAYRYNDMKWEILFLGNIKKYQQDDELNKYTDSFDVHNNYKSNELKFKSAITYLLDKSNTHQIIWGYNRYEGKNKRVVEGINYEAKSQQFNFGYWYKSKSIMDKIDLEFGLEENLNAISRQDFAIGSKIKTVNLTQHLVLNAEFKQVKQFYHLKLAPYYRTNISKFLNLEETQETKFTQNVVIPDFLYTTQSPWGIYTELGYGTEKIITNYTVYFSIQNNYCGIANKSRNTLLASAIIFL